MGPVDVYLIGFPGNQFSGQIVPALVELVVNGTIRIVDMLFVTRDADGLLSSMRVTELDESNVNALLSIEMLEPGTLGQADISAIATDLPANSSALLIAAENSWARKLTGSLVDAHSRIIKHVRIGAESVNKA